MPSKNPADEQTMADKAQAFGQDVADRAADARDSIVDMTRSGIEKGAEALEEGRSTTADRLDSVASSVRDRAGNLPGGEKVRAFAQGAADRLNTGADYIRSHDVDRMKADLESLVKNNPGPALLVAAAFGFLLGRALSRD